mmetsp:Transcript_12160/g.14455  ORF Transcript_12160/g.14455 Transcript_12160/m.14455 type:complete len:216 (+) Transcript_12160:853-1500(+)
MISCSTSPPNRVGGGEGGGGDGWGGGEGDGGGLGEGGGGGTGGPHLGHTHAPKVTALVGKSWQTESACAPPSPSPVTYREDSRNKCLVALPARTTSVKCTPLLLASTSTKRGEMCPGVSHFKISVETYSASTSTSPNLHLGRLESAKFHPYTSVIQLPSTGPTLCSIPNTQGTMEGIGIGTISGPVKNGTERDMSKAFTAPISGVTVRLSINCMN